METHNNHTPLFIGSEGSTNIYRTCRGVWRQERAARLHPQLDRIPPIGSEDALNLPLLSPPSAAGNDARWSGNL